MPFCVRNYVVYDEAQNVVCRKEGNYQSVNTIVFKEPLHTRQLTVQLEHPSATTPAALFEIRCYA
jgi:hypothetical protein